MLAGLLNIPNHDEEWKWFAWQHRLSHDRIRQAIKDKYKVDLTDYQIEPFDSNELKNFLQNNASLHTDMNGVLHLQGIDLFDTDLTKENQRSSWIFYHWQEHASAEAKLGTGS
jgi:hypothetical protein